AVFSTFIGGSQVDSIYAVAVDAHDRALVTGQVSSPDYPIVNPFLLHTPSNGSQNVPVTLFDPTGQSLIFSTVIGGSATDGALAASVDGQGNFEIGGYTVSVDFPGTINAFIPPPPGSTFTNGQGFITRVAPAVAPTITLDSVTPSLAKAGTVVDFQVSVDQALS